MRKVRRIIAQRFFDAAALATAGRLSKPPRASVARTAFAVAIKVGQPPTLVGARPNAAARITGLPYSVADDRDANSHDVRHEKTVFFRR